MVWVLYKGVMHVIVHDYGNGLVDIREVNGYRVSTVAREDLEIVIKPEGR
jgi:hypothetical protein